MVNLTYYHVSIKESEPEGLGSEYKLDLTKDQLKKRILKPYKKGSNIVIGGRTISVYDIERINISKTEESSEKLLPKIKRKRKNNSGWISPASDEYYVMKEGEDVTDEFITEPPGSEVDKEDRQDESEVNERKVFVVHGRNLQIKNSMFDFLRAIDLKPIEWPKAIEATGDPSPYIGDILDEAFSRAQAVVVLMTPDEEVRLREEFREEETHRDEKELKLQPRPNVLFEGGMAWARYPNRTVLVKIGEIRHVSDIAGLHYVKLDNTPEKRDELATKLGNAGCPVDTSGTDWYNAGDFEIEQD